MRETRILYIAGSGHSGSTLLDLLLGSHPHIESIGEIIKLPTYLDPKYGRSNMKCTCNVDINDCDYWNRILRGHEQVFSRINNESDFESINSSLYERILNISGKEIICDSSKSISRLDQLLRCKTFKVFIVHIVRDGRAVAYSNYRKKSLNQGPFTEPTKNVKQYDFDRAIKAWQEVNKEIYMRFNDRDNYLLIKYEDLCNDPNTTLNRILNRVDLTFIEEQLDFSNRIHHNVGGNRMRGLTDQKIELDKSYRSGISRFRWLSTSLRFRKSLSMFGYKIDDER